MSRHSPTSTTTSSAARVIRTVQGMPTSDGAGVKLRRVIGTPQLPDLDPFLMLDEFGTDRAEDYIAGFPEHPHRGFETVTYMLDGRMRHRDNHGNEGLLVPGAVQWMTAGRGVVHSEMPEQQEGRMRGFQLWVNLPSRLKMSEPAYQEFAPERIPVVQPAEGVSIKVVGELNRPPYEKSNAGAALYEHAKTLAAEIGFDLVDTFTGGGSDGNFTAPHTATLDGLGVDGQGAHTHYEQMYISSIEPRARLLYRLYQTLR